MSDHIKQGKYQVKLGSPFELDVVAQFVVVDPPRSAKTVQNRDEQRESAA
jgi:hypothetical protein